MIIGHKRILGFFNRNIERKRLAHAYLFWGSSHLGKKTLAEKIIKDITGQDLQKNLHPDVLIVEQEDNGNSNKETEIGIAKIRQLQRHLSLSPYQAPFKVALIEEADRLTSEAGNCLLKTLEEPPARSVLILITSKIRKVLPTVISRCQLINFLPVAEEEMRKLLQQEYGPKKDFEEIIKLASGRPGLAINYLSQPDGLKDYYANVNQLIELLESDLNKRYFWAEQASKKVSLTRRLLSDWRMWFRELMFLEAGSRGSAELQQLDNFKGRYSLGKIKEIIKKINETDSLLADASINHRLALEVLMLDF